MNKTLTASALLASIMAFAPLAEAAELTMQTRKVKHQLDSANSAKSRLKMISDRYCVDYCRRMAVDVGIVDQALLNFENQVFHGMFENDGHDSQVQLKRVLHQFESVRSALERLKFVATKQTDRRRRVEVDVSIVEQVVQNLENQARNALRAQSR